MINKLLAPFVNYIPENNRLERIWKLAQVDFRKRFYNHKLGLLWALINPLLRMGVYYFVFTFVFEKQEENYALFIFGGLVVWMSFKEGAQKGLKIIQTKKYLFQNIQFKHVDLFISQNLSVMMGTAFSFGVYLLMCLIFADSFGLDILYLPLIFLEIVLFSMGTGMILATCSIFLKDITHVWAFVALFGFWTSGVFFRTKKMIEVFPPIEYVNPFLGIIGNMRAITLGVDEWSWGSYFQGLVFGIIVLLIGYYLFSKNSHRAIERL